MSRIKDTIEEKKNQDNEELEFNHIEWLERTKRIATIRIPCEQFAFIEIQTDATPTETIELYRHYTALYKGGIGITEREFQQYLDAFITKDSPITADEYAAMSREQQNVIQVIKRAIKRIRSREEN